MPKKQTTAGKKARATQHATGAKYTDALRGTATCGQQMDPWGATCRQQMDPWGVLQETCARPPHTDGLCSPDRDFDAAAWQARTAAEDAAAQARWDAMTPEQREAAETAAREQDYDYPPAAGDRDDHGDHF